MQVNIADIHASLNKLKLPELGKEVLFEIAQSEGTTFIQNLDKATQGVQEALLYVNLVTRAVSPFAETTLKQAGFSATKKQLIVVAKAEGLKFFEAIRDLTTENAGAAKKYLQRVLSNQQQGSGKVPDNEIGDFPSKDKTPHAPAQSQEKGKAGDGAPKSSATPPAKPATPTPLRAVQAGNTPEGEQAPDTKTHNSFHVYAGKGAVCFNEDMTQKMAHTLRVEATLKVGEKYDWDKKIAIQLTHTELLLVYATFIGILGSVNLEAHGQANDKFMSLEAQEGNYYIKVWQKSNGSIPVPIPASYGFIITSMLYKQIQRNHPHLSDGMIEKMVDRMCDIYLKAMKSKAA